MENLTRLWRRGPKKCDLSQILQDKGSERSIAWNTQGIVRTQVWPEQNQAGRRAGVKGAQVGMWVLSGVKGAGVKQGKDIVFGFSKFTLLNVEGSSI